MADAGTTPDVPVVMDGDVIVEFNEASSRQQINSGESVKTLFGKLKKFLTDLKAVAFSGAYSDLSGVPDLSEYAKTADVPNIKVNAAVDADTVGGHSVNADVPENAVFTDTIPDLSPYAKTADIRNENLLINPDFKINQRNLMGWAVDYNDDGTPNTATQKYVMDRWRIMDGTITIADGKVYLTGTIIQVLENSIGGDFTASVSVESGTATASYDDSTKTFTIVGNSAVLNWAKLEHGSNATQFFPPDTATELLKCMRYYEILLPSGVDRAVTGYLETGRNAIFDMKFSVPKRCVPSLTSNSVRIIVNTFDSYLAILNNCPVIQGETDKHGVVIESDSPVISSVSSGYIGVTMDAIHNADLAVDAEIY